MDHLTGFEPLAQRYQGFILDLWGVIHDGVRPYPGAADCLGRIRALGKPAVLLSTRRAAPMPPRRRCGPWALPTTSTAAS